MPDPFPDPIDMPDALGRLDRRIESTPTRSDTLVLATLRRICADGWPVMVREIAHEAGIASPQTVHAALRSLEERGLVRTNPRWPSRRGGWRPVG